MSNFTERFSPRVRKFAFASALLLAGAFLGGGLVRAVRPVPAMAPAAPLPIASAATQSSGFGDPLVTVRGTVTALYGNSFTLQDASGQALVETSRGHHDGGIFSQPQLVAAGQTVTVQGWQNAGTIRAQFIVTPDGKAWAVGGHGRHRGRHSAPSIVLKPADPAVIAPPTSK